MRFLERAARPLALVFVASAWAAAFACVPSYSFNGADDAGTDAALEDHAAPPDTSPPPDATPPRDGGADVSDADASDAAPFRAQIFVKPNDLGGGNEGAICAIRNGALYCWGNDHANDYGELGFPPTDASTPYVHPMRVTTTMGAPTQLVMGLNHTCSLYGRSAYCRGSNGDVQLANASVGSSTYQEVPVTNLPPVDAIAAAGATTCGIILDGYDAGSGVSNVLCWGRNIEGECGRPLNDTHDINQAWPLTGEIDGGPTGLITDAVAIAGGGAHFCVLTARHTIECWGGNQSYESGPIMGPVCPNGIGGTRCSPQPQEVKLPNGEVPTEIALGDAFSCALAQSGSIYCWGNNQLDQLANGGAATATCTSSDGKTSWPCSATPTKVMFQDAVQGSVQHIFAGGYNACAIDAAHRALCWGNDYAGEYGNGSSGNNTPFAHLVVDMNTSQPIAFDELAMGGFVVCGRSGTTDYCWGGFDLGTQVGDAAQPSGAWAAPVQF